MECFLENKIDKTVKKKKRKKMKNKKKMIILKKNQKQDHIVIAVVDSSMKNALNCFILIHQISNAKSAQKCIKLRQQIFIL